MGSISLFFFIMVLFSHLMLGTGQTITTTNPTWSACPLIKSSVISVKTTDSGNINANSTNTTAITYSSAFSQVPRLTFAIRNIRRIFVINSAYGNMQVDQFVVTITSPTATGFTLQIQLYHETYFKHFRAHYLALDRTYNYHLNLFTNV
jgi:hypothetical protein